MWPTRYGPTSMGGGGVRSLGGFEPLCSALFDELEQQPVGLLRSCLQHRQPLADFLPQLGAIVPRVVDARDELPQRLMQNPATA